MNPDVDPQTHKHTTTGVRSTKFGVDIEDAPDFFRRNAVNPSCDLCGLHAHIGSPVRKIEPYVHAVERLLACCDELEESGHPITVLDLGGGFAADYETGEAPPAREYALALVPLLKQRVEAGLQIIFEPGRSIAANAGLLLTRVQYVKDAGDRRFAIVDAGMHTLLRPSHYDAFHFIWPCSPAGGAIPTDRSRNPDLPDLTSYDVVGPICETGDYLALTVPSATRTRRSSRGLRKGLRNVDGEPLQLDAPARRSHGERRNAQMIRTRDTPEDLFRNELEPGSSQPNR